MYFQKIILPLLFSLAFYMGACSNSVDYQEIDSATDTVKRTVGNSGPVATYAPLAPDANPAYAVNNYAVWLANHYVTEEVEATYYNSIQADFTHVFNQNYVPAGRVIWSAQSGYYKNNCAVMDSQNPGMKYRGCTVSEGMGYGMLLAYFNNDIETFNRMWNYTRAYREYNNVKLTPRITFSFHYNDVDRSSATDADLDIATALILMYYRTDSVDYLNDAISIAQAIWDLEVNPANKLLYSGDQQIWKTNPVYNLSYFSPVALRLFAIVDPAHDWIGVLDAMYTYMQLVQSLGTGVFPDWSDGSGMAANPPNESADKTPSTYTWYTFNKESVRIPWRISWDYYWYQDPRAAAILNQLNTFISTKASGNTESDALKINYSWDLSVGPDYTRNNVVSNQWYAAWCATAIAGNHAWLSACTKGVNARKHANTSSSYFDDILFTLYSCLLNGLFLRPM